MIRWTPIALALLFVPEVAAQHLQLRGTSPLAAWNLSPSLGIVEDSLHRVGRGVYVRDIQAGNGDIADSGTIVSVHYVGQLADGRTFSATSRDPFRFRIGADSVIAGWEDGVLGMRVGGRRQLVIPPHLGYGADGNGNIPPDAVLVFDVTLVDARKR
ncbi:MAG TPA: FKBP-type peptidyl-prolyl cis-trans isomerase [Gemmatimonadales bacterium]|nr:FKBP-type peptidyl-prolyl cis-trans isomerase [Gemmatimonadales bacterium]